MISIFACGRLPGAGAETMIRDAPPSRWTGSDRVLPVTHPRGRLLFDTGLHCDTMTNMLGRYGEERAAASVFTAGGDDAVSTRPARPDAGRRGLRRQLALAFRSLRGQRFFRVDHPRAGTRDEGRALTRGPGPGTVPAQRGGLRAPLRYQAWTARTTSSAMAPGAHHHDGHTPGHQSLLWPRAADSRIVFRRRLLHAREHGPRRPADGAGDETRVLLAAPCVSCATSRAPARSTVMIPSSGARCPTRQPRSCDRAPTSPRACRRRPRSARSCCPRR